MPRAHRLLLAFGVTLGTLGFLSFVAVVVLMISTGHGLSGFSFVHVAPVTYVATFVTLLLAVVAMLFVGALRFVDWYRQRRAVASFGRDP
jgi:hypothetical protein